MKSTFIAISLIFIGLINLHAQEKLVKEENTSTENKIHVELKNVKNSDVYIDGKKYNMEIFNLLDPNKIETITVLKGEEATKQYNTTNSVILVTSKKDSQTDSLKVVGYGNGVTINNKKSESKESNSETDKEPLILINGEVTSKKEFKKIHPERIVSIEVLKDEYAQKKYNAPNGVIVVKTKY